MTFNYQPSAAGISWLALSETIDQRTQMEQALLELSKNSTAIQCNMTRGISDATFNELNAQANGLEAAASAAMAGALFGCAVSVGTFGASIASMPKNESQTITNNMGIAEKPVVLQANEVQMQEIPNAVQGAVEINGRAAPAPATTTTAATNTPSGAASSNETGGQPNHLRAQINRYFTDHGSILSQTVSSGFSSSGQIAQAEYTRKQAVEKSIEVAAQGISQVMNQQQSMLSSTISSCDTFFNNTESTATTIIQVSAVRG